MLYDTWRCPKACNSSQERAKKVTKKEPTPVEYLGKSTLSEPFPSRRPPMTLMKSRGRLNSRVPRYALLVLLRSLGSTSKSAQPPSTTPATCHSGEIRYRSPPRPAQAV